MKIEIDIAEETPSLWMTDDLFQSKSSVNVMSPPDRFLTGIAQHLDKSRSLAKSN